MISENVNTFCLIICYKYDGIKQFWHFLLFLFTFIIVLITDQRAFNCCSNCLILLVWPLWIERSLDLKRNCNAFWLCLRTLHFSIFASNQCLGGCSDSGCPGGRGAAGDITHRILLRYLWYTRLKVLRERTYTLPLALMPQFGPPVPWYPSMVWTATGWVSWDHGGVLVPHTLLSRGLISEHNWKHLPKVEAILATE